MIKIGNYAIQEYPKQNKLEIYLPQTIRTATSTVSSIENRKDNLSDTELAIILTIVKKLYEGEYSGEEDS